jgi:hypothetical protein
MCGPAQRTKKKAIARVNGLFKPLFRFKNFLIFNTVELSFLFTNNYPIINHLALKDS